MTEKKAENFQLPWRILEKKIYQPMKFKQNVNKNSFRKMAANKVETAMCLPSGVSKGFMRNLLWQHLQQQQQENINQFTSPPTTPAMSEMSSGNTLDD